MALFIYIIFNNDRIFNLYILSKSKNLFRYEYSNFNRNFPSQRSNPPKKSYSTQKLTLNDFKTIETTIIEKNEKQNDNKLEITDDSQTKIQKIGPYSSNENEKSKK